MFTFTVDFNTYTASKKIQSDDTPHFIYLHGDLETLAGYDIPTYIDGKMNKDTFQDCIYIANGKKYECVLIQWESEPDKIIKGLICLKNDKSSICYGVDNMIKKSQRL